MFDGVTIKYVDELDNSNWNKGEPDYLFFPLTRENLAIVKGIDTKKDPWYLSPEERERYWNGEDIDFTAEHFGRLVRKQSWEEEQDETGS